MNKFIGILVLVGFSSVPLVYAANEVNQAALKQPVVDEAKHAKMRKMIEEKKAELNGSEWKVKLTITSDPKARPEQDALTFQNGQVRSKAFSDRGFVPTNYTITVPEGDEMSVWETMQTSQKEGVVFIRGEWKGDQMRGIVSQQMEGGKTKDYTFTTESKAAISPTSEKKEDVTSEESKDVTKTAKNTSPDPKRILSDIPSGAKSTETKMDRNSRR